jgi:hypothetical protein
MNHRVRDGNWMFRAVGAALIAGSVGYLPSLLWPRDMVYDLVTELAPSLVLAVPSFIACFFGRFWLANLTVSGLIGAWLSIGSGPLALAFCLCSGGLAAGISSWLAKRWEII